MRRRELSCSGYRGAGVHIQIPPMRNFSTPREELPLVRPERASGKGPPLYSATRLPQGGDRARGGLHCREQAAHARPARNVCEERDPPCLLAWHLFTDSVRATSAMGRCLVVHRFRLHPGRRRPEHRARRQSRRLFGPSVDQPRNEPGDGFDRLEQLWPRLFSAILKGGTRGDFKGQHA